MYKSASSIFMDGVGSTINKNIYENRSIPFQKIMSGKEFNNLSKDIIHLKVLRNDMLHHDLQYKKDYNEILNNDLFNIFLDEYGIHFTNPNSLFLWLHLGDKIHIVYVPDDAKVVCFYDKCKSDKLIIGNIVDTLDDIIQIGIPHIKTLKRFIKN